ncbi:MFS transporter [Xanthomonas phaseoli pv. syngonii LMG 9055]|uniref:MFS transporter n=1 Tax=Xanthomonas phaseoli pv. syngonii LMG 9055 TaxID=1437878 RepID=A0A1V9GXX1_9XANT|nr:MFS transporter [Xanthomonas phaseoli pv. syngonii LMG 9055]
MTQAALVARRRVLAGISISYVIVLLDTSIVNVTLDRLATVFDTQISGLQWVLNAYTLMFASLLLTGGKLGDRFGARKIYLAGLMVFMSASVACATATALPMLVIARAMQGVGAAMLVPCSLKLIHQAHPDLPARARAIGLWAGLGALAMAAGPLIGGILIQGDGWRSVFFVNVPLCLVGLVLAGRMAKDRAPVRTEHIDWKGQACAIIALTTLIGVLIEGGNEGWTSFPIVAGAVICLAAWATLLRIEAQCAHPMLPLFLFRNGVFVGSMCVSMASAFVTYGLLFVVSLNYQQVRGYSPLQTGLALLPMTAMVAMGSIVVSRRLLRFGPQWPMMCAFACYAVGAAGLALTAHAMAHGSAVVSLMAIGLASGVISPLATAPALETIPPSRVAAAAAVLNAARQMGAALGVAVFGSIMGTLHPAEVGLQFSLAVAVVVSIIAMPAWWLALRKPTGAADALDATKD